ncbi:MAG TPA: hypothetical protein VFZ84_20260 [Burkholderiales bacterium]
MPTRARTKPRLLLAGTPSGLRVLCPLLDGEAELLTAETLPQATRLLGPDVDVILCTLRFDESRMFDFLRVAKRSAPDVAFVCCRATPGTISERAIEAIALAARSAGAAGYLDLARLRGRYGVAAGDAKFRAILLRLASLRQAV